MECIIKERVKKKGRSWLKFQFGDKKKKATIGRPIFEKCLNGVSVLPAMKMASPTDSCFSATNEHSHHRRSYICGPAGSKPVRIQDG